MKPIEKQADRLFAAFIRARDGRCVIGNPAGDLRDRSECWGELECAHLLSRRFMATRWDPRNAVALCEGHHRYMTEHPLAWADWREELRGPSVMRDLIRRAYGGPKPDVAAIVEQLKGAA